MTELTALYAEAVANIVHVNLADGRTLTKRVDYPAGQREEPAERFGGGREIPESGRAEDRQGRRRIACWSIAGSWTQARMIVSALMKIDRNQRN